MKFIHLIWLWETSGISDVDAKNVQMWTDLNRDWTVKVWGGDELETFIERNYEWAAPAWHHVKKDWESTREISHLAKLSDLARYLLLYHDHTKGGKNDGVGTEWNFYCDTDTTPLRSLSDFLDDTKITAIGVQRVKSLPEKMATKLVNYKTADVIISSENFNVRPGSRYPQITNCAIMSRPGIALWEAMVQRGIRKINQDVLRSWGTWALTDFLTPQLKFNRIIVMPSFYFNFCIKHMETPPPVWCVCTHLNAITWGDPASKQSWITGRSKHNLQTKLS